MHKVPRVLLVATGGLALKRWPDKQPQGSKATKLYEVGLLYCTCGYQLYFWCPAAATPTTEPGPEETINCWNWKQVYVTQGERAAESTLVIECFTSLVWLTHYKRKSVEVGVFEKSGSLIGKNLGGRGLPLQIRYEKTRQVDISHGVRMSAAWLFSCVDASDVQTEFWWQDRALHVVYSSHAVQIKIVNAGLSLDAVLTCWRVNVCVCVYVLCSENLFCTSTQRSCA